MLNIVKDVDKTFHGKGRKGLEPGRGTAFWKKRKSFGKVLVLRMLGWGVRSEAQKGCRKQNNGKEEKTRKEGF